jgi:hypothetical protein
LSRERVLQAALELADAHGFGAISMRNVFSEIEVATPGSVDWRTSMRQRAISVRAALNRHRWAVGLMEGRMNPGPANVRNHDGVLGCLRESGFPFRATVHAYSLMDAYICEFEFGLDVILDGLERVRDGIDVAD